MNCSALHSLLLITIATAHRDNIESEDQSSSFSNNVLNNFALSKGHGNDLLLCANDNISLSLPLLLGANKSNSIKSSIDGAALPRIKRISSFEEDGETQIAIKFTNPFNSPNQEKLKIVIKKKGKPATNDRNEPTNNPSDNEEFDCKKICFGKNNVVLCSIPSKFFIENAFYGFNVSNSQESLKYDVCYKFIDGGFEEAYFGRNEYREYSLILLILNGYVFVSTSIWIFYELVKDFKKNRSAHMREIDEVIRGIQTRAAEEEEV